MIYTDERLVGFAYATHRRKQVFGRDEIARLRRVRLVAQRMKAGDYMAAPAQEAAAFRRSRPQRMAFHRKPHRLSNANDSTVRVCLHSSNLIASELYHSRALR